MARVISVQVNGTRHAIPYVEVQEVLVVVADGEIERYFTFHEDGLKEQIYHEHDDEELDDAHTPYDEIHGFDADLYAVEEEEDEDEEEEEDLDEDFDDDEDEDL
jgi:hypothetical protein